MFFYSLLAINSHTRSNSEVKLDQDRLFLADELGWVTGGTACKMVLSDFKTVSGANFEGSLASLDPGT